jgi:hypothetical protein
VEYQGQEGDPKSAADLANSDEWRFADLQTITQIIEASEKTVKEIVKDVPAIDESIQDIQKSQKKSIVPPNTFTNP